MKIISSINSKLVTFYPKLMGIAKNKEFILTLFSQFIQLSSGMVLVKILTNQLELKEYGSFSLVMSVSAFVLTIPFTAIQQGFYRYRSIYKRKRMAANLYTSMFLGVIALSIIYIILAQVIFLLVDIDKFWTESFSFIALFVFTEILKIFSRCIVNADRKRATYACSIILEFSLKMILTILIASYGSLTVKWVLISYTFANILSIAICFLDYKDEFRKVRYKHMGIIWKKVLVFSSPLLLWAGFGWSRDMSIRWFLEINTNTDIVAIYTVLGTISLIIPTILQSVIGAYFIPILYEKASKSKNNSSLELLDKIQKTLLILGVCLFVVVFFLADEIILTISSAEYVTYSWALPWMFAAYYLYICGMIYSSSFLVSMEPKKLLIPNVASGALTLIFGLLIIPTYGFEGAVFSYVTTYLLYFLLVQLVMKIYGTK